MIKPVITCFSDNNKELCHIVSELHNYYGSVINQTIFEEVETLTDSLKNNNILCNDTQLLVADFNCTKSNYISFVTEISKYCANAVKLILAEQHQLEKIKISFDNDGTMLFLKKPWNIGDFNNALGIATDIYENRSREVVQEPIHQNLKLHSEHKVQQRLQKLIDANLAKDSFLSIISHDLKSPFMALQGISEILLNDWITLTDEEKLELIGDLHKTSADTYKLLETLLEWAKIQKEKLDVIANEIKIHHLVNSTLKVSENHAAVKGIKISNNIDKELKVFADKNIVATVFRNLVSNAVKYTQPGGMIDISAKQGKTFCTFCVADNGSGIDKPHVLELFSRKNPKKLNGNVNTFQGLGLIICKDFVEKSGGEIWLETVIGQGSKFYFTIPCQT